MPIPAILWAAGAIGTAYLAWKNRDAVIEIAGDIANSWTQEVTEQANYLVSVSRTEALHWLQREMPNMDFVSRSMLVEQLALFAREDRKAEALYSEALRLDTELRHKEGLTGD